MAIVLICVTFISSLRSVLVGMQSFVIDLKGLEALEDSRNGVIRPETKRTSH